MFSATRSFRSLEQRALFLKHVASTGIRLWTHDGEAELQMADAADERSTAITIWIFSTDQGVDQKGVATCMSADVRQKPFVWMFRQWCLLHELALMVKTQLVSLGDYWGSLAKLINVWRSGSNAKYLYKAWEQLFGTDRAKAAAGTLPPRRLQL